MMDAYLTGLEKPVGKGMPSRMSGFKFTKRKYFRQPKIYQNDYILDLQDNDQCIEFLEISDKQQPEYNILLLFFVNQGEGDTDVINLLIGREKADDEDCSGQSSEKSDSQDYQDSQQCSDELKDDDSPYFVMIVLDS